MRLTKTVVREAIRSYRKRQAELVAILITGGIKDELRRCLPVYQETPSDKMPPDERCLLTLLCDALDQAFPAHWFV